MMGWEAKYTLTVDGQIAGLQEDNLKDWQINEVEDETPF